MSLLLSYNNSPIINAFSAKRAENFKKSTDDVMPVQIVYSLNTSDISEEKTCSVTLKVDLSGEGSPIDLSIELEATFNVNDEPTKEELQNISGEIAGPILFTSARDYIAEFTRKMGFPPLLLPFPEFKTVQKDDREEG